MAASPFATLPATASTRPFWRFGLLTIAFALLWAIGSMYGLGVDSSFDGALCNQLAAVAAWGLRVVGWSASTSAAQPNMLLLTGHSSVIVGPPCNGLVLYVLLAGFVLAYPGPTQRRLWFIPAGIAALWLINVVRIMGLALNLQYSPETFEFDHHYAFNAIAYSALGGLWLLWTRQSGHTSLAADTQLADDAPLATPSQSLLTPRLVSGVALLLGLVLINIFHAQVIQALSLGWATALAVGPAWLHRLPGAGAAPAGVSNLALPVGMAYVGLFLAIALLVLYLLLPARSWRVAYLCYTGMLLCYGLLLLAGRLLHEPSAYRIARMLLDFLASLLPLIGLLVLLWRPTALGSASRSAVGEPQASV